jgi:predicted 2-oxoglutarate/Fe(II)-dependent dioxygenase YbiX
MLFCRLDKAIENVSRQLPNTDAVRDLTGVFSGLGRLWMEP